MSLHVWKDMASGGQVRIDGSIKIDAHVVLQSESGSPPTSSSSSWLVTHGMAQLDQLNAMERGQDVTTWSTNAIYSATNGVLIVAAVSSLESEARWLIILMLSLLGGFLASIWFAIVLRAHVYEITYLYRARWIQLQTEFKDMPKKCAIWQEPDGTPTKYNGSPGGRSSWSALHVLVSGFFMLWVLLAIIVLAISTLEIPEREMSEQWQTSLTIVGTVVILITSSVTYFKVFVRPVSRMKDYFKALRTDLGLPEPPNPW